MTTTDNQFWKKLILVLLPLFIIGVVNTVIMWNNLAHLETEVQYNKETKVTNEVLLQYIQLHKQIHDATSKDVDGNSEQIKALRIRLDNFITKYLSYNSRGSTQNYKIGDYLDYICQMEYE